VYQILLTLNYLNKKSMWLKKLSLEHFVINGKGDKLVVKLAVLNHSSD